MKTVLEASIGSTEWEKGVSTKENTKPEKFPDVKATVTVYPASEADQKGTNEHEKVEGAKPKDHSKFVQQEEGEQTELEKGERTKENIKPDVETTVHPSLEDNGNHNVGTDSEHVEVEEGAKLEDHSNKQIMQHEKGEQTHACLLSYIIHPCTSCTPKTGHLTIANMREVLDALWECRSKWKFIGIELAIKSSDLDAIERNHKEVEDALVEVIKYWLYRISPKPTRTELVKILESKYVSCDTNAVQGKSG